ncbi:MAG TPA: methyltransferase domain-containing protein [Candidatus Eisenbacteria bacterium]|nr:methyltransferase domain-containing protein [Candidatus Eisenbacteria bacterium]
MRYEDCLLCGSRRTSVRPDAFGKSAYSVRRCRDCRTEWVDPIPDDETLKAFYANYHHSEVTWEYFLEAVSLASPMAERLAAASPAAAGRRASFLDVGGASGFLGVAMARRGYDAAVQDISDNAGKWLERSNAESGQDVRLLREPIDGLAAAGQRFDVVNASQILEHVPDPENFLRTLARLVKPGGRLFVDTPNNEALVWCVKNAIRPLFRRMDFYNSLKPPEHLWGYTGDGLRALAAKCGLEVLAVRDYGLGDGRFQPASRQWYLTAGEYARKVLLKGNLSVYLFGKTAVAMADRAFLSRVLRRGGGLSAVFAAPGGGR